MRVKACLLLGLICYAMAFRNIIIKTSPVPEENESSDDEGDDELPRQASDMLQLPDVELLSPPLSVDNHAKRLVYNRVYAAYLDLRRRNRLKEAAIEKGLLWLKIGLIFVGIAIAVYICGSEPV